MNSISDDTLHKIEKSTEHLMQKRVSRKDFMKFCTAMAALLALPASFVPKIAEAVSGKKPYLVWLEFQDCAGDTEALLRAAKPTVAQIILDILYSGDYHETIMSAAGHQAEEALMDVVKNHKGEYIVIAAAFFKRRPLQ